MEKMKKKILFVCRYNRFRSVLAEAFFNKYNKNKSIVAKSAAPIKGMPLSDNVKKLAKEFKIKIKNKPHGLTSKLMKWQNITVIVADNVPKALFNKNKIYGKKVIHWHIPDVNGEGIEKMRKIARIIKKKVIKLIKDLEK
jgi:protein-tyrosine-phosphatase